MRLGENQGAWMLSHVEEERFYRTYNDSIVYVLIEETEDDPAWLVVLSGGSEEFAPGDCYFLRPDGSVCGDEGNVNHPMLLQETLDLQLPICRRWNPLRKEQRTDYHASRREWVEWMLDMQHLLEEYAEHSPPVPEVGSFYLTLNWSVVYVLENEEGDVYVALLKGGAAQMSPGSTYRLAEDGSPGGFNPLEFGLTFREKLGLGWE